MSQCELALWKIARNGIVEYDEYRAMIVCASSEDMALFHIARDGRWSNDTDETLVEKIINLLEVGLPTTVEEYLVYEMSGFDETDEPLPRAHWIATRIGTPTPGTEPGIILSDFKAG
ncbi:hypothetical protein D3C87_1021770 [compost metagenome]